MRVCVCVCVYAAGYLNLQSSELTHCPSGQRNAGLHSLH